MAYFEKIIMQPTSLCNLNCSYCYLPDRDKNRKMSIEIAEKTADSISTIPHHISIIWHGGEPLACGVDYFKKLLNPFEHLRKVGKITHSIQTNATLITTEVIRMFKDYDFEVGVSIDGPEWANNLRVNWNGTKAYEKIISGINLLKVNKIEFGVIAVISNENITKPTALYDFFSDLGCTSLALNIEEQEGDNIECSVIDNREVYQFWRNLLLYWYKNPMLNIREFSRGLSWIKAVANNYPEEAYEQEFDYFPSIAHNGDVVLLSPELLDTSSIEYDNFIVGNILQENLSKIIESAQNIRYIVDYKLGKDLCQNECNYYSFCRGGQASNKFFELNTLKGTQTLYCKRSKQILIDVILDNV